MNGVGGRALAPEVLALPYSICFLINIISLLCTSRHPSCFIKSLSAVTRPPGLLPEGRARSLSSSQVGQCSWVEVRIGVTGCPQCYLSQ